MIRRRIIIVLTLAAMGMGALWIVLPSIPFYPSSFPPDLHTGDTPELRLRAFSGGLVLTYGIFLKERPPEIVDEYYAVREWFGCEFSRNWSVPNPPPFLHVWSLRAPFWPFIVLFLTYPTIAFIRGPLRRWHRRRKGLCLKCAYDLTGNVSGVCPECGMCVE